MRMSESAIASWSTLAALRREPIRRVRADYTAADAVNSWVSENQYYDHATNTCAQGQECGHYTQVVWRDSTMIGCARVVCNNGGIFITCNYYPPGNIDGQSPY
uniref:SCP domain-containing protein n=1 Tax=Ananas comosus var. bracteatus TaxID=296719 RepID=A0A6V7NML1_ANACO|nr:unnamed protein product [Ananas comosus var. bracteatus]